MDGSFSVQDPVEGAVAAHTFRQQPAVAVVEGSASAEIAQVAVAQMEENFAEAPCAASSLVGRTAALMIAVAGDIVQVSKTYSA